MKRLLLIAVVIFVGVNASAQNLKTIRQYFDIRWNEITNKQKIRDREYSFYRIAKQTKEHKWHVQDYYAITNSLQMEGMFADDSLQVRDGLCYFYYYNGQLKSEARYYEDHPVGLYKAYSINGQLLDSSRYKSTGIPYHKSFLWDEEGHIRYYAEFDTEGNGSGYATVYYPDSVISSFGKYTKGHLEDSIWVYFYPNGQLSLKKYYDSGRLLKYECYDEQGEFTSNSCDITYSQPEPGYNVNEYVDEHVEVPKALSKTDKAGPFWVNISFVVEVDGTITNVHADCPSYQSLTIEAVRVMSNLPKWQVPARRNNIPMRIHYTKPFEFVN